MAPGTRSRAPAAVALVPLGLLLSLTPPLPALGQVPEYQLKAEFLERFSQFVEWPEGPSSSDSAPFVIGLYGGNPFGSYLAGRRTSQGHPIQIHEISDPAAAAACHIVFVTGAARRNLARFLAQVESKPVLTVADTEGFAQKGVIINFYSAENRVAFEVNDAAARKSGLKISSKLLRLARIVNLEPQR